MEEPEKPSGIRVGLFTDTFDDINGVCRFIRDMGEQAAAQGCDLTIATSSSRERFDLPNRTNFKPMYARPMLFYPQLESSIPPLLPMLAWAERQRFDAIHVSTPGFIGCVGFLASRLLRVPMLTTFHTDFPAYVKDLSGSNWITACVRWYMARFYKQAAAVFSRSEGYRQCLRDLGVQDDNLRTIIAGINTSKFNAAHRDEAIWCNLGITKRYRLLYAGRISVEKNLPLMVEMFRQLCTRRNDVALVIAGEGPYEKTMSEALAGLPVHFTGALNDQDLAPLYATSDLFVFPSRTDTLGQVVMEAQSSGLPTLVSPDGGPKESIVNGLSGLVLPGDQAGPWVEAISSLLDDPSRRAAMSAAAIARSKRYNLRLTFEHFWQQHVEAVACARAKKPVVLESPSHFEEFESPTSDRLLTTV